MKEFYTKKEYEAIAELFDLGKIDKIKYFHYGYHTPKIMIQTQKGKFVIAKHNLSTKGMNADLKVVPRKAAIQEIKFLKTLKNLPIPKHIKSKNNKYLEDYENFAVSVYKFLPGISPRKISPIMAKSLGEFLGKFHNQSLKYRKSMPGRRKFYDLKPQTMSLMEVYAQKQKNPILKKVVSRIKQGVKNNLLSKKLPRGPVHVDIGPNNELFIGEKLTGILDFGNMYKDALLVDVGKTIMWNCVKNKKLDQQLKKKFLEGYNKYRKFTKSEKLLINKAILFAIYSHIWVDLYHVPIKYVPEKYTLFLVKNFLPVANELERLSGTENF